MKNPRSLCSRSLLRFGIGAFVLSMTIGCGFFSSKAGLKLYSDRDVTNQTVVLGFSPSPSQTTHSAVDFRSATPDPTSSQIYRDRTEITTPTYQISPMACIPKSQSKEYGLVKRVISGDTILVDIQGNDQIIHYAGINSPLIAPIIEEFGPPAATSNAKMVKDQVVEMVRDGADADSNGSLLRYVVVYDQGVFVNYELLKSGLAEVDSASINLECHQTFQLAQGSARAAKVGLWASTPSPMPTITTRPTSSRTMTFTPSPTFTLTPSVTGTPPTPTPSLTPTNTPTITTTPTRTATATFGAICDLSYEDVCIPPPPPYFTCLDIPYRNFKAVFPDPHDFDKNFDEIGCGPGDF